MEPLTGVHLCVTESTANSHGQVIKVQAILAPHSGRAALSEPDVHNVARQEPFKEEEEDEEEMEPEG